ncbi:MAG: hypothetical protein ABI835_17660 [Chloroflexota bacterium]
MREVLLMKALLSLSILLLTVHLAVAQETSTPTEWTTDQRGASPTPHDRWLATRFGSAAVHLVAQEKWGSMVALRGNDLIDVPMAEATQIKYVDPAGDMVQMARDLGIVFG